VQYSLIFPLLKLYVKLQQNQRLLEKAALFIFIWVCGETKRVIRKRKENKLSEDI
jgi:hypothetical protein